MRIGTSSDFTSHIGRLEKPKRHIVAKALQLGRYICRSNTSLQVTTNPCLFALNQLNRVIPILNRLSNFDTDKKDLFSINCDSEIPREPFILVHNK